MNTGSLYRALLDMNRYNQTQARQRLAAEVETLKAEVATNAAAYDAALQGLGTADARVQNAQLRKADAQADLEAARADRRGAFHVREALRRKAEAQTELDVARGSRANALRVVARLENAAGKLSAALQAVEKKLAPLAEILDLYARIEAALSVQLMTEEEAREEMNFFLRKHGDKATAMIIETHRLKL